MKTIINEWMNKSKHNNNNDHNKHVSVSLDIWDLSDKLWHPDRLIQVSGYSGILIRGDPKLPYKFFSLIYSSCSDVDDDIFRIKELEGIADGEDGVVRE
jgi:hypothetical protein